MKIAICFSGQIRTGVQAAPNILNYIGDLLPQCDFYVHTWDRQSDPHSPNVLEIVDRTVFADFFKIYSPLNMVVEPYCMKEVSPAWGGFRIDKKLGEVYALYETIYKANRLKVLFEDEYDFKYDFAIRIRPDLVFDPTKSLKEDLSLIRNNESFVYGAHKQNFGNKRLEDIFWIAPSHIMDSICNFYSYRALSGHCGLPQSPNFIDTQVHIAQWITQDLKFQFQALNNNNIKVFRFDDINLDPVLQYHQIKS